MKITRIELFNFGSYAGKNVFDLTSNKAEQRVIVIGGKNGAGKTTLFTAIEIGLYGNYAFGFKTAGRHYLKQVYSLINNQARVDDNETAYVELSFEHIVNSEKQNYCVKRLWSWNDNKVEEQLIVKRNNETLEHDALTNFQNYLIHLIPPDLLKLYFFDGEKIADYFLGDQTINIQNALMILSGNDTFEIIEENAKRVLSQSSQKSTDEAANYLRGKNELIASQNSLARLRTCILETQDKIDQIKADLKHLVDSYSAKGGITLEQWSALQDQLKAEEEKRERLNWQRKALATDVLPFWLLRNTLACIEPQIQSEKDYITYHALKTKLDDSQFTAAIQSVLSDNGITSEFGDVSVQLANKLRKLLLDKDWSDFSVLFGLSAEDERQVLSVIERVFRSDSNTLKNYKRRINSSITRSKELRDVLQNSSIDSFEEFSKARVDKELEQQRLEVDLQHLYTEESSLLEEIQFKQNNLAVAKKAFEESLKKESMAAITGRLVLLLEDLQDYLFRKLIAAVEHDLKMKFGQLIRKKDFFDDIVIDRTWNVHIIRNESVAIKDILALLEKKDLKVIDRKLGSSAVSFLLDHYKVKNANELHYKLSMSRDVQIQLPVEVEKDRMSSGEKQIFVMSLYWALMQQSKNALPFIIDTPFARIDTEHRHNITENFFKKLTGQLFVLSTDEELSGDHLGVMKEQISHVYMLDYGSDHKTHVKADQYFEV